MEMPVEHLKKTTLSNSERARVNKMIMDHSPSVCDIGVSRATPRDKLHIKSYVTNTLDKNITFPFPLMETVFHTAYLDSSKHDTIIHQTIKKMGIFDHS